VDQSFGLGAIMSELGEPIINELVDKATALVSKKLTSFVEAAEEQINKVVLKLFSSSEFPKNIAKKLISEIGDILEETI